MNNLRKFTLITLIALSLLISSCKSQAGDGMFTGHDKAVIALDNVTSLCQATGGHPDAQGICR